MVFNPLYTVVGLLVLGNSVLAQPALPILGNVGAATVAAGSATATTTKAAAATAAGKVDVPPATIDAATIVDATLNSTVAPVPGKDSSSLLAARPDIAAKVNAAPAQAARLNATVSTSPKTKRTLGLPASDCNPTGTDISPHVWIHGAEKVCKHWFPDDQVVWQPSNAGYTATFDLGFGGVSMTYGYGVTDFTSGLVFYEPFSFVQCIADLTQLITDMHSQCVFDYGVSLGAVPFGAFDLLPFGPSAKWYSLSSTT